MKRDLLPSWPLAVILAAVLMIALGCGDGADTDTPAESTNGTLPANLFLTNAPDGAQSITSLKQSAKKGDEVVVRVVVGGRADPIVKGRASTAIIDADLGNGCLSEGESCMTPWDYCCTPTEKVTANLATLQIVDEDGRVLAANLSDHIKPLATLTVRGVVGPRPNTQVLTINATGIHVQPVAQ